MPSIRLAPLGRLIIHVPFTPKENKRFFLKKEAKTSISYAPMSWQRLHYKIKEFFDYFFQKRIACFCIPMNCSQRGRVFLIAPIAVVLLASRPAQAQLGPLPGLSINTLNQANGPAKLDALGNASTLRAIATGSTTPRTLADINADRLNVKNFGAVGDNVADDSAAIAATINRCLALGALGKRSDIYFPPGTYRISATTLPVMHAVPCGLSGDGVTKSIVAPDVNYVGDVFAYADAWYASSCLTTTCTLAAYSVGPSVRDIAIEGNTAATNPQIGFHFYDHNDVIQMENVIVDNLNSSCMVIGDQLNDVGSYARESYFSNLRLSACGASGGPAALEITGNPNSAGGGDSTNELYFVNTNVFSNGPGVRIRNNNAAKVIGAIRWSGLRIEHPLTGLAGDSLTIGDPTAIGSVASISIDNFIANAGYAGYDTIHLMGTSAQKSPFDIRIRGSILTGSGNGVEIAAGSNLDFDLTQVNVTGTGLIIGAAPLVGRSITFNTGLAFNSVKTSIDPSVAPLNKSVVAVGDPASGILGVTAYQHDGTAKYGDPIGLGSVDLMGTRAAHNYAVTGAYSAGFGNSNAVQGPDSFAAGILNVIGGSAVGSYVFGQANTVTGGFSNAAGLRVTDRGRYGYTGFGSGGFTGVGDGQVGHQVLRANATAATAVRLLSDGTTVPNGANSGFIPAGAHYHTKISATCRDTTALGWATWDQLPGDLDRPASAVATYAGGYSNATAPTRSNGTLTGMTLTAAADSTTQSISVMAAPAASNTDTIHCVSQLETSEEVQ